MLKPNNQGMIPANDVYQGMMFVHNDYLYEVTQESDGDTMKVVKIARRYDTVWHRVVDNEQNFDVNTLVKIEF